MSVLQEAEQLLARIRKAFARVLPVRADEITPTADIVDDLGLTDQEAELVMSVEGEFGIEIPDEDAEQLATVEDWLRYVLSRQKPGASSEGV
jgi:acyl carrier protein